MSIDEDWFNLAQIYRYLCEPKPQPSRFACFKLPYLAHILPLIEALPDCRVLWCVRNPLDVVWSMINLNMRFNDASVPWPMYPLGGWFEIANAYWVLSDKLKSELSGHMAEFSRLSEKIANLSKSPENPTTIERRDCVYIGALCWKIKNELPRLYEARKIDFHVIRYVDLVTDPKDCIARMLDYIRVEWRDEVLKHHHLHEGITVGNTDSARGIDQNSLGNGKRHLTQDEQDLIKEICGSTAQRWNYTFS